MLGDHMVALRCLPPRPSHGLAVPVLVGNSLQKGSPRRSCTAGGKIARRPDREARDGAKSPAGIETLEDCLADSARRCRSYLNRFPLRYFFICKFRKRRRRHVQTPGGLGAKSTPWFPLFFLLKTLRPQFLLKLHFSLLKDLNV